VSYSALGFLPSVVVHSALKESESARKNLLIFSAYGLSALAAVLHFQTVLFAAAAPSNFALQILTFGSLALLGGLLFFNYRQTIGRKAVWISALLIFTVSALHLSGETEEKSWLVELVAHQSSLPLALVILLQDFRFAFADLFLKRALSLILLTLAAFALYIFIASPLLRYHETHDRNDAQAIALILALWITTALVYPLLHRFAVRFVDKILLRRADYETLRAETAEAIEKLDSAETVLDEIAARLKPALTAREAIWKEVYESETNLPSVDFSPHRADVFIPTAESPFYRLSLKNFAGGRHLLSDEIEMLEAISLIAARRIDALRVTHERCEQELREQEFSKLATEAQLSALRAQINPHFLFNALTTIGYLIQTAPDKAFATLMRLTSLLRGVLRSTGEFSTLAEELKLIDAYLEIEKARFEERLRVTIEAPNDLRQIRIPSLILQPLVENAIKHGISKAKSGGEVKIAAKLETKTDGVFLRLTVADSGHGFEKNEFETRRRVGVGLNNIEQRLQNYYGGAARLRIESANGSGTRAEIVFPISEMKKL
jgi:two-component sensor histidine kinase